MKKPPGKTCVTLFWLFGDKKLKFCVCVYIFIPLITIESAIYAVVIFFVALMDFVELAVSGLI